MTEDQARKLATRVAKESDAIIRFGVTNGRRCLHIRVAAKPAAGDDMGSERRAGSETIYDGLGWDDHKWNNINKRRREKRQDRDVLDAVANREAA